MVKHLLTKEQRQCGLTTIEDEDFVRIVEVTGYNGSEPVYKTIATFSSSGATIKEIQETADKYLEVK